MGMLRAIIGCLNRLDDWLGDTTVADDDCPHCGRHGTAESRIVPPAVPGGYSLTMGEDIVPERYCSECFNTF